MTILTFKQFLEKSLPNDVTLSDVSGAKYSDTDNLPELDSNVKKIWSSLITDLSNWIDFHDHEGLYKSLSEYKKIIPQKFSQLSNPIYRGLSWSIPTQPEILSTILHKKSLHGSPLESWTTDEKIAEEFARSNTSNSIGVMIKLNNPSSKYVLMDVVSFINDRKIIEIAASIKNEEFVKQAQKYAKKEKEVILKGLPEYSPDLIKTIFYNNKKFSDAKKLKDFLELK